MRFKHSVDRGDRFQNAYTDINVELTIIDLLNLMRQLNKDSLYEVLDEILKMCKDDDFGDSSTITIEGDGDVEINMDQLTDMMDFNAYMYAHHKEMNHVILTKPSYVAGEIAFMDGLNTLRDKIQHDFCEDIFDGNI
jgi:hypothetical protein